MAPKYYWKILLSILSIVTAWFALNSMYQVFQYVRLSASTSASEVTWTVKEINDERYLLNGQYSFRVDGNVHSGETALNSPFYLNPWAAEQAIPSHNSQTWEVWYSAINPNYSSLQKYFPFKECLSTLLLGAVMVYFVGLRRYVAKNYERSNT